MNPLAIDLFCGLGGWAEGFLSEGYRVIGFDIEKHDYGAGTYPGELILRDVRSINGSEFSDATIIVASPPCQAYSYRAMPWSRAKALPPPDNTLFNECFRIQREASEAAGRYIPLIVENVRGAQKWVGRARWHYGSYYLWGDVPALMPITLPRQKFNPDGTAHPLGSWFAIADSHNRGAHTENGDNVQWRENGCNEENRMVPSSIKVPGQNWNNFKETGEVSPHWRMEAANVANLYADRDSEGTKQHGSGSIWFRTGNGALPSKSSRRKAASAQIAKIPFPLAQHIARCFKPLM